MISRFGMFGADEIETYDIALESIFRYVNNHPETEKELICLLNTCNCSQDTGH